MMGCVPSISFVSVHAHATPNSSSHSPYGSYQPTVLCGYYKPLSNPPARSRGWCRELRYRILACGVRSSSCPPFVLFFGKKDLGANHLHSPPAGPNPTTTRSNSSASTSPSPPRASVDVLQALLGREAAAGRCIGRYNSDNGREGWKANDSVVYLLTAVATRSSTTQVGSFPLSPNLRY